MAVKIDKDMICKDLYELLDVTSNASSETIVRAYRKKARKFHPDKNPDDPSVVKIFLEISKALDILTDSAKRSHYDRLYKARIANEEKRKHLDSKRRKLKDDLETREALSQELSTMPSQSYLKKELERLRKEGSDLLKREQNLVAEQVRTEASRLQNQHCEQQQCRLKIYKSSVELSEAYLRSKFENYGDIDLIVINKGKAIIEFSHVKNSIAPAISNSSHDFKSKWLIPPPHVQNEKSIEIKVKREHSPCTEIDVDSLLKDEENILKNLISSQNAKT